MQPIYISSGLFFINKKEKYVYTYICSFLEMNSRKNVSVYIELKNELFWNRKSCKKKCFTDGKTPLKMTCLRS